MGEVRPSPGRSAAYETALMARLDGEARRAFAKGVIAGQAAKNVASTVRNSPRIPSVSDTWPQIGCRVRINQSVVFPKLSNKTGYVIGRSGSQIALVAVRGHGIYPIPKLMLGYNPLPDGGRGERGELASLIAEMADARFLKTRWSNRQRTYVKV